MKYTSISIMEHLLSLPEKTVIRISVAYVDEHGRLFNEIANDARGIDLSIDRCPLKLIEESEQTAVVRGYDVRCCDLNAECRLEFARRTYARTIVIAEPGGIADYRLRYNNNNWTMTRLEEQEKWSIKLADVDAYIQQTDDEMAKITGRRNALEDLRFNLTPKPAAKYPRNEDI